MGDDTWDGVGGHPGFGQDSEFFHCNCEGAEAGAMWVCGGCYSVPLTSLLGSERKGFSLPRRGVWLAVMKKTVACGGSATISFIVSGVMWCCVGLFLYTFVINVVFVPVCFLVWMLFPVNRSHHSSGSLFCLSHQRRWGRGEAQARGLHFTRRT